MTPDPIVPDAPNITATLCVVIIGSLSNLPVRVESNNLAWQGRIAFSVGPYILRYIPTSAQGVTKNIMRVNSYDHVNLMRKST